MRDEIRVLLVSVKLSGGATSAAHGARESVGRRASAWLGEGILMHGPLGTPYPCMGMIFGIRAGPRVMSSKCSDDFQKIDPCEGKVQFETNLR